jgi:hypothetical protein
VYREMDMLWVEKAEAEPRVGQVVKIPTLG